MEIQVSDQQGKGPPTNEGREEKNRSRQAENKPGGTSSSGKSGDDAAVKAQQQQTRDSLNKTLGK